MAKTKRESILRAATLLFAHHGFKETSISELSKLTGAAEGTIFHHFKSKEQILEKILEETRRSITEEFEQYFTGRDFEDGMHMMEAVVSFYLYLSGILEDQFLLLHRHFIYQCSETNDLCRGHLEAIYACLVDLFEKAVVTGQADGSIAPLPPRKTALLVFTMVDGLVRFKTYNLYDAGALYNDLIVMCRRMLATKGEG